MTRHHRSRLRRAAPILAGLLAVAACSPDPSTGAAAPPPATAGAGPAASPSPATPADIRVARGFTDALNRGDGAAARASFAATARFDSVGRIYPDRDAIFGRFLDPEVIAAGGRYTELSTRADGDRLVVEYEFTTRSGGREHFTYAYRIENGLIVDVIGRYL
jgi:hypothetical protein